MTSLRVSAQGGNYVFPPSADVGIGIAETADVVLLAAGVSEHHARLAAEAGTWFREQRTFPVGMPVRVGRDPSLELVSLSPLVSRQVHGIIVSDARSATYTDQSRRGTFLDGKPLHKPLRITQSVVLRLGDPATGEELGITPPLSSTQLARNRGRRLLAGRVRVGAAAAAAVVVVAGLAAVATAVTRSPTPARAGATLSDGLPVTVLHKAEAAIVRLLIGSRSSYTGWGSGTLISPTGLILTNAHVAEPEAPGEAVAAGVAQLGADPRYLTVELTTGQSSAVIARYRARPVAVDGYLDLAVVQIYASSGGKPVSRQSLHLPYLAVGNVRKVQPATSAFFGMRYDRFPKGLDIAMAIAMPDGTAVTASSGGLPQSTATATSGCFAYELSAPDLGLATLPTGTYQVQLLGGPDLTSLSAPTDLTVGTARQHAAKASASSPSSPPSSSASTRN